MKKRGTAVEVEIVLVRNNAIWLALLLVVMALALRFVQKPQPTQPPPVAATPSPTATAAPEKICTLTYIAALGQRQTPLYCCRLYEDPSGAITYEAELQKRRSAMSRRTGRIERSQYLELIAAIRALPLAKLSDKPQAAPFHHSVYSFQLNLPEIKVQGTTWGLEDRNWRSLVRTVQRSPVGQLELEMEGPDNTAELLDRQW